MNRISLFPKNAFIRPCILFILFIGALSLNAQNPFPEDGDLFNSDVLPRIDIHLDTDSLDQLLAPGNEQSNHEYPALFIFQSGNFIDTVENVGFRLRGNTSRHAAKKSFKVSFNTYEPGRDFQGVEKLNINGEHNDPIIARSKISWDMLRWLKVPAPRSNHVEFYINGEYYGLFINVEHIDEEFVGLRFGNNNGNLYKCLYPADLIYLGDDPDLYQQEIFGRRPYDLRTNTDADDYSDLANFIDILNNVPIENLPCQLEQVFNVDSYLRALVYDILAGNWDGPVYNKNNFYLYRNTFTGQFEYIPYDLDNTFGIDWLNTDWGTRNIYDWSANEPRPLYDRLLQVPEYRKRFSYYMNKALDEFFNESILFPYADQLKAHIDEAVLNDPLHSLDYGYSFEDYEAAWTEALGGHADYGLKPYISTRYENSLNQLDLQDITPIITNIHTNTPGPGEEIIITAQIEDDNGLGNVRICFQLDFQDMITCLDLHDDGTHNDGEANDGNYGIIIPGFNNVDIFSFYIEASDNNNQTSRQPNCIYRQLTIGSVEIPLYINEFMADNDGVIMDEAGEFDDWLELYNGGTEPIFLGDKFLTDNLDNPGKWEMPNETLAPGAFLLIWADEDQEQGTWHTNFKLSAMGESIGLYQEENGNFLPIDTFSYGPQNTDVAIGRLPNGTGPFQVLSPTPGASNEPVAINEVLANPDLLNVFPNPNSGLLQIRADCIDCQIEIVNPLGQRLLKTSFSEQFTWKAEPGKSGTFTVLLWKDGLLMDSERIILIN